MRCAGRPECRDILGQTLADLACVARIKVVRQHVKDGLYRLFGFDRSGRG